MGKDQSIRERMLKIAGVIQRNKYMTGISNGLAATVPMLLGGAIFSLIDSINIPIYQNFLKSSGLKALTGVPASVTTNLIALYAVFSIANALAGQFKKDGVPAGMIAIMAFLIVTPMGAMVDKSNGISTAWLGAQGLFVAMIVAVIVSRLYVLILDKEFYIKMPKGVPPTIEKAFAAVVPAFIIIIIMLSIRGIFGATSFGDMHKFIFSYLQVPLTKLGGSWWATLITVVVISVLWFLGVHGVMVVYSVVGPIWTTLRLENLTAFQAGQELPNAIAGGAFFTIYATLGGSCSTIGLAIALVIARSKRYKTLGSLAIVPSILGINEPLMFGVPIVLNTRLLIPMICAPLATGILGILATVIGLVPKLKGIGVPMGTPIIVSGFIEGGWKVAVLQAVMVVVSFLIYYPFFKIIDNEACEQENAVEA